MAGIDLGGCLCDMCPLSGTKRGSWVGAQGPSRVSNRFPSLMLVGEAPGRDETFSGIPFFGQSGQELDNYLTRVGVSRDNWWVTNLVKCRPPANRDPKPEEVVCCKGCLEREIELHQPLVIAAVGRYAVRYFLGQDADMEMVHGIPYLLDSGRVVVPCYHPAYGLRNTTEMTNIYRDFEAVAKVVRGEITPRRPGDDEGNRYRYYHLESVGDLEDLIACHSPLVAVDTESILPHGFNRDSTPWCLTFADSTDGWSGYLIRADNKECLKRFGEWVQQPHVTTILHNALWDLGVLAQMGVHPRTYHDTMVMAYLLQDYPKGLKPLGYRLLGVNMTAYEKMIAGAQVALSLQYLSEVKKRTWPNPEPRLVWEKGIPKIKQPQNIGKKVVRMFKDLEKNPDLDLVERWNNIEDKIEVERVMGAMPVASLADIPFENALEYAGRDAVVTLGVYPELVGQIHERGLWEVFERDVGIIPMVMDMMWNGMRIDPDYLKELSRYFEERMEETQGEIETMFREHTLENVSINPKSPDQTSEILWKMGIFDKRKQSTASEELDKVRHKHPIVNKITYYRQLAKLKGTYTDTLPTQMDHRNRVHTRLSTTRVVTGRLSSSEPNLHNQPKRGEEGKKIRQGFIAEPGYVLFSCDYSQIEMRVLAHVSQDPTMLRLLLDPTKDIHSETASWVFNVPIDKVDKDKHRYPAKRVGFGIVYGLTGMGLQKQLLAEGTIYTEKECDRMVSSWLEMYSVVNTYLDEMKAFAKRNRYVVDFFGRRRLVPEVLSVHPRIRDAGLRQAINAPIQGGAQGIIKEAMSQLTPIYREWVNRGWMLGPLMQIHDDLIFEIKEEYIDDIAPVIVCLMENAVPLTVPTPVDPQVGPCWGKLQKYRR